MNSKRVSAESPRSWELGGESMIHCELHPAVPVHGEQTIIRLTHGLEGSPWAGTFQTSIVFPAGKQRIELKVVSEGPLQSGVISDWRVKVTDSK